MTPYETLPVEIRCDVDECVTAFYCGGKHLGALTFRAICEARKLELTSRIMLSLDVQNRLSSLGYLQIV